MQKASVATERVAATLNAGQSVVLSLGLTAVLAMAASGGTRAGVTAGDLVSPTACSCTISCHLLPLALFFLCCIPAPPPCPSSPVVLNSFPPSMPLFIYNLTRLLPSLSFVHCRAARLWL